MSSVVLVEYDSRWPGQFADMATTVAAALGSILITIEHVGSTAIPGICAKPIIDLDAIVLPGTMAEAIARLEAIGYLYKGDQGIPGREAFRLPSASVPHHLYVCYHDNRALLEHLRFRDALRDSPALASEYDQLKRALAIQFAHDRPGYVEAKTSFVHGILAKYG